MAVDRGVLAKLRMRVEAGIADANDQEILTEMEAALASENSAGAPEASTLANTSGGAAQAPQVTAGEGEEITLTVDISSFNRGWENLSTPAPSDGLFVGVIRGFRKVEGRDDDLYFLEIEAEEGSGPYWRGGYAIDKIGASDGRAGKLKDFLMHTKTAYEIDGKSVKFRVPIGVRVGTEWRTIVARNGSSERRIQSLMPPEKVGALVL